MRLSAIRSFAIATLISGLAGTSVGWAKPIPAARPEEPAVAPALSAGMPRVDSGRVHKLYLDGEFDAAIAILEDNLKETRQYAHGDSVFIFKHLGVMYAARYETREKGKYYMHKLLMAEPTARIMDMYASDMIYMIFKNIHEEYEQNRMLMASQRRETRRDSMPIARPAPDTPAKDPAGTRAAATRSSGGAGKWVWAGVAAATVAAGVGAYILMSEEPEAVKNQNEFKF